MKTLPNGLTVFNATPHPITFWQEGWGEPVNVPTDEIINATPVEQFVCYHPRNHVVRVVRTAFVGTPEGERIIARALEAGADVIIGSIIAAQAYPGEVLAMTPAPGFERVPPDQKRMNPDKFTTF
jgi:hypothetical protein